MKLTIEERQFFKVANPAGVILFGRNIENPDQVKALINDLKATFGRDVPILIDQEGGRVRRLRPPHWRETPAMAVFEQIYKEDPQRALLALELNVKLLGMELKGLGINVNCLPVLDIPQPNADPIISDRAFSSNLDLIIVMGKIVIDCLMSVGCLPVIKHIPGHGRALVDSHKELPRVDVSRETLEAEDFKPFKALSYAPFAMTAHIIYEDIDPENEATFSKKIISEVIRKDIGFEGLLMSDDLGMNALSFDYATRAQKTFDAGVDLGLHCSGIIEEMREIASVTPPMTNENYNKLNKYLALTNTTIDFEKDRAEAEYNKLVK